MANRDPRVGEEGLYVRVPLAALVGMCAAVFAYAAGPMSAPTRLTDGLSAHSRPAWSPDGQWVAYVTSGSWGDAVCVARPSDGLTQAVTGGLDGSVVGRPQWLVEPFRVAWVTERGQVGSLDLAGEVITASLSLPSEPRGLAPLNDGHAVAVSTRSSVVKLPGDLVGAATPLAIGSVNSDITSIEAAPGGNGLVLVDAGSVVLWRPGAEARVLLSPGPEVAEWRAVSTATGCESAIVIARTRTARAPDRICALDLGSGSVTVVCRSAAAVSEAVPVPGTDGVAAIIGGRLTFVPRPGATAVTGPTGRGVDAGPAVSPDGALVAFSSAGRDDTDLDGRVDAGDPPNLYLARLRTDEGGPAG